MVIKAPDYREMTENTYEYNGKCYNYKMHNSTCSNNTIKAN